MFHEGERLGVYLMPVDIGTLDMGKDVIAMLCLTALAIASMATDTNHDMLMLIVGGLISLGGAVVGNKAATPK